MTSPPTPTGSTTTANDATVLPPGEWMIDGVSLNGGQPAPNRIALFVVHGMGQQSHFDTISGVSDGLRAALRSLKDDGRPESEVVVQLPGKAQAAFVGDQRSEFVSFDLRHRNDDTVLSQLHVFEGYWAPQTEGVVKLADVMRFLITAALGGERR